MTGPLARPAVDALILDLGNVLVFHDNALLYREMAAAFHTTPETMRARLDAAFWAQVNQGQLPGDALRQALVERLGHPVAPDAWFALWNCHFTLHHAMIALVEKLAGRLPLVLLSNTHDQHFAYLRPLLPVLDRFQGIVLSYELGAMKPAPEIYERALALAGVRPERAAFFDDIDRYAEAATALGLAGRVFTTAAAFAEEARALGLPLP